jgi:hypothetical protein
MGRRTEQLGPTRLARAAGGERVASSSPVGPRVRRIWHFQEQNLARAALTALGDYAGRSAIRAMSAHPPPAQPRRRPPTQPRHSHDRALPPCPPHRNQAARRQRRRVARVCNRRLGTKRVRRTLDAVGVRPVGSGWWPCGNIPVSFLVPEVAPWPVFERQAGLLGAFAIGSAARIHEPVSVIVRCDCRSARVARSVPAAKTSGRDC